MKKESYYNDLTVGAFLNIIKSEYFLNVFVETGYYVENGKIYYNNEPKIIY